MAESIEASPLSTFLPPRPSTELGFGLSVAALWRREPIPSVSDATPALPEPDIQAPPAALPALPTVEADETWSRYASEMAMLERRLQPLLSRDTAVTLEISGCIEGNPGTSVAHALAHHLAGIKKRVLLCADTTQHRSRKRGVSIEADGTETDGIDLIRLPNLRIVNVAHLHRAQFTSGAALVFGEWIAALKEQFDIVILDMPSLLDHQPWTRLLPMIDGVVLVVQAAATHTSRIRRTLDLIEEAGGHALGFVFNRAHRVAPKALNEWLDETRPMRRAELGRPAIGAFAAAGTEDRLQHQALASIPVDHDEHAVAVA